MKPAELITKPLSLLTALGLAVMVSACGGSSSGSSSTQGSSDVETGIFLDSPVINLGYRTQTQSDSTNSLGEYSYIPGETVTFFIGDLEFPETDATFQVTPLNLANTSDTRNPVVINMIRLLQTLDKDGDPENGIEITQEAIKNATQVDFSLEESEFENSTAVQALIFNAGQDSEVSSLVNTEDAIQHFEQSLEENLAIDMTTKSASSVIIFSECPEDQLGWEYTFTNKSMTLTGSDTWNTAAGCTTGQEETFTLNMVGLESDFDVPFNCAEYPICRSEDFNKTITGTDGDSREFTSTYSFDRQESELTYEKSVEGTTFTEVISIQ